MKPVKKPTTGSATLRHRAEEIVRNREAHLPRNRTDDDTRRLLQELELHQIELELQNVELRQAREDTESALERYRDLYEFAPVSYFTLDSAGTIRSVNLTGASLLGHERSGLIGLRFEQFIETTARQLFAPFLARVFATQGTVTCEMALLNRDNHQVFVQIEANADESGQECRIALLDITGRRLMEIEHERVEVALQKSESKFSRIFNAVPALIGITTLKEGRFIDVNQASLQTLGYQREEMLGKTARELGLWEDEAERLKVMRLFMEQGSLQNLEIRFKGKTGQTFTGLCSAEFIELDDLRYMLILVRNITERKIAEEEIARLNQNLAMRAAELEDANRELEAFNYSVAHDLRQPLNVICSYCQIFTELCSDKLEKPCRRYIQETYDGARRMSRLIEALLNFSRLSHVETIRKRVDLSAMAREAFLTLKLVEPGRQVEFRSADGIFAHADATLLRVVLDNLLGNAWKYTGMQTEAVIEFGAMEPDGNTVFYIRDNGAGFDMKHADQLFTPFQRLPGAEECRGFGIGLATVERIIRRHGGTIWGEGEPGKGATFYFTLGSENRTPGGEHHEDPDS